VLLLCLAAHANSETESIYSFQETIFSPCKLLTFRYILSNSTSRRSNITQVIYIVKFMIRCIFDMKSDPMHFDFTAYSFSWPEPESDCLRFTVNCMIVSVCRQLNEQIWWNRHRGSTNWSGPSSNDDRATHLWGRRLLAPVPQTDKRPVQWGPARIRLVKTLLVYVDSIYAINSPVKRAFHSSSKARGSHDNPTSWPVNQWQCRETDALSRNQSYLR
jgi:hypothetical protein